MHALCHRNAIRRDDVQLERVLIHLGQQGRGRNGEHKRFRRGTRAGKGFCSFAHGHQIWVVLEPSDFCADLFVRRKLHGCSGLERQACCHLVHLRMFSNCGHREASREKIEPTDALLECRVHRRLSDIGAKRNAGDLTQFTGPPNQPPQRGTWNIQLCGDGGLLCSGQHLLDRLHISMESLSLCIGENRGIKGWTRNRCARFEWDGSLWDICFWKKGFWERIRDKRWSIRWQQGQRDFAIKRVPLQID